MSGSTVLTVLGSAIELAGLVLAAFGFHRTWAEFSGPDESFLQPITKQLDRATLWLSRVLHHPLPARTVHAEAALAGGSAFDAKATKTYGPLPSISENPEAFAEIVQARLTELLDSTQQTAHALQDELEKSQARHREVLHTIEEYRSKTHGEVQQVAVGGLRQQVAGWLLVVVGLVLQTWGQIAH